MIPNWEFLLKFSFAQLQDPGLQFKPTVADGTAFKFTGMYLGVENDPSIKKNQNILITQWIPDINDKYIYRSVDERYKRRGTFTCGDVKIPYEKGEYKYRTGISRKDIYPSITSAWKAASTYPQVAYGKTFRERSVLILDSDDYYDSLEEATALVDQFCEFYKMDKPFSVTRNTSSGHIQVSWPLDKTFTKRGRSYLPTSLPDGSLFYLSFENFNALNKNLARMWTAFTGKDGDMNFNGPSCKNPFYKGFQAQINPDVNYTCNIIPQVITFLLNNPLTKKKATRKARKAVSKPTKQKVMNKTTVKKQLSRNYRNNLTDVGSRRAYEMNNFRTWYFRYRNTHNGMIPDMTTQMEQIKIIAKDAATVTHKEVHSNKELTEIVNTVNKWCNKKYKKGVSGNAVYTEKERSFGRFIQQMQRLLIATQAFSLVNTDGMNIEDVCKTLEISQATAYRALRMSEADFDQLIKSAKKFLRFAKNVNTASIDFFQKVSTIKNTIELYYKFVQVLFKAIVNKIINKDSDPFSLIQLINSSYNELLLKVPINQTY